MTMKKILFLILIIFSIKGSAQEIPVDSVKFYFDTFKKICDNDNGSLWGLNLYTPMIVFNEKSRFIVTNFADKRGILILQKNGLYTGILPDSLKPKNIGKSSWVYNWPISEDNFFKKISMMIHESFHYFQDSLKLKTSDYQITHIDSLNARITIRMEWLSLERALINDNKSIAKDAIIEALIWRNYRRLLYPNKIYDENKFEIHEGLPKYTDIKLASQNFDKNLIQVALDFSKLITNDTNIEHTFTRSFGYVSGLFYALLLDKYDSNWRKQINEKSDMGELLAEKINIISLLNLKQTIELYKENIIYKNVENEEIIRKSKIDKKNEGIKIRFTENPVLLLDKTSKFNYAFNPATIQLIGDECEYLPFFNVFESWGELRVKKDGGIIDSKKNTITIPAINIKINDNIVTMGENWELKLKKDWSIIKNEKNYKLKKK